jgi:hypothetical protein
MLEIVRGRPWSVAHTVYDSEGGPLADLTEFASFRSQIREKNATRNRKGFFEHKLVADVTVTVLESVITLSLPVATVDTLHTGDYLIDLVGIFADASTEALLVPEPVVVVNRPTAPFSTPSPIPLPPVPPILPDFSEEFETALID